MPTPIQTTSPSTGYGASRSVSLSSSPAIGNVVIIEGFWSHSFGTTPTSITFSDNQTGNTWSGVTYVGPQDSGVFFGFGVINSSTTGTFTVTCNGGAGADLAWNIAAAEFPDLDIADLLDQQGSASIESGNNYTVSASSVNTGADRLVLAAACPRGGGSWPTGVEPPSTGYTSLFASTSGDFQGAAAYKTVSSLETSSVDWGALSTGGGQGAILLATLKVGGGGPATHATSGALAGQGAEVSGAAARTRAHGSSGALTGPGATVVGSSARTRQHASSGALAGPGSAVAGAAARTRAHPTSGVLTGQGSAIAGSAARTRVHPASGDLVGPGSTVVGAADRQSAAGVHDTSGALVGQGSLIAGSANRVPNHSTTGTLVGQGSTVAGAAARFRAFSTSGVLTGQGSAIAGIAARVAGPVSHATTGVLVGAGSEVNGSAARAGPAVTHNTSGVLVGPGSTIAGEARIGELMQDTHDGFWAKQWDRIREREKKKHLEEIREDIEELDEQIAEVQAAEPPKPVKKAAKASTVPQRNFYAEQARVIEQLIAERQRLIEMEEEEMLLLL